LFYFGLKRAILFVCVFLLGCGDPSSVSVEELLERAHQNVSAGNHKAAEIDLKSVLQSTPDNAEARLQLGKLYLELEDGAAAQKELERAAGLSVGDSIEPLLARALLLQGQYQQLVEMPVPAGMLPADQADLLGSHGLAWLALGELPRASNFVDTARELSGSGSYPRYVSAMLLATEGKEQLAQQELLSILQVEPEYGPASALLGDIAMRAGDLEKAEEFFSQAIAHKAASVGEQLKLAWVRAQLQQYDQAGAGLDDLQESVGAHPQISYIRGLIYYHQGNYQNAEVEFENALTLNPEHVAALFYSGTTNYVQGNYEVAESRLRQYASYEPDYVPANRMLAAIKLSQGDNQQAELIARRIIEEEEMDVLTLTLLANSLLAQNLDSEGREIYEKVVAIEPESPVYRTDLALAMIKETGGREGVKELETAIDIDPSYERAQEQLIVTHLQNREIDRALEVATQYYDQYPDRASASVLLGTVYMDRSQAPEAKQAFDRAAQLDPGNPSANSGLAAIALQNDDLAGARAYYAATLLRFPDHLTTLINLATVQQAEGNLSVMQATLEKAVDSHPEALQPRLLLARHLIYQGQPENAIQRLSSMREAHAFSVPLLSLLAESQFRSGEFRGARSTLLDLIAVDPENAVAHYTLARVLSQLGDKDGAARELDQTLRLDPRYWRARIATAERLLVLGELAEAAQHIQVLKQQLGDRPDLWILEGRLKQLSGKPEAALALFRQAHAKAPSNISLMHQAGALVALEQSDEALSLFKKWLEEYPEDAASWLDVGSIYLALGDIEGAREAYSQVVKLSPDTAAALNNLAWSLIEKSPEDAVKYAKRAVELAPASINFKDTYAMALRAVGEYSLAKSVIDKVNVAVPASTVFRYHRAQILNDLGEHDAALVELELILQPGNEFEDRADAEALQGAIRGGIAD